MIDVTAVNLAGEIIATVRVSFDDTVYDSVAYQEWYAEHFPASMEYPEFVKTYYALHLTRMGGDAAIKRAILRTPVYSNGKAFNAEDRNVKAGIVQTCSACKQCPTGSTTSPETNPCELGLYELRISGVSNDVDNFGATSVTITWDNYNGTEQMEPFVIPVPAGAGWRDTLFALGTLPLKAPTAAEPELDMHFVPDDTDPESRLMVIQCTPVGAAAIQAGTFTLVLNPIPEATPSHGVAGIPVLPVVACPDFQHLTFSLCTNVNTQ